MYKKISRDIDLNFDILPRSSRSGVGMIKVQDGRRENEICMGYIIVFMLYDCKNNN